MFKHLDENAADRDRKTLKMYATGFITEKMAMVRIDESNGTEGMHIFDDEEEFRKWAASEGWAVPKMGEVEHEAD